MRGLAVHQLLAGVGLALCLEAGAPVAGRAQSGSVLATATISTTALTVLGVGDLSFGNVLPGVPVTVNPKTSSTTGKFEFHGNKNAQINVSFAFPAQLSTGMGGWTMPIAFGATSGCENNQDKQNACAVYDPSTPLVVRLRNQNAPGDTYFVWLGGVVSPAAGQHAGVYIGTITVTAYYTGL